jgi:hypothetical protein
MILLGDSRVLLDYQFGETLCVPRYLGVVPFRRPSQNPPNDCRDDCNDWELRPQTLH